MTLVRSDSIQRARFGALLGCVLAAVLIVGGGVADAAAPLKLKRRAADFPEVVKQQDLRITMPDGVDLAADVYRPANADGTAAPGRFPALLVQTPYNKNVFALATKQAYDPEMVKRGYVMVLVDVRGTGSSEGSWDSFGADEQRDTESIARWLRRQRWSNGTFGTYGSSYMGIIQFFTAARHPPGLKAIFPIIPAEDVYRDVTWHGGAVDAGFIPFWLGLVTALKVVPPNFAVSDPVRYLEVLLDRVTGGGQFVLNSFVSATTGGQLAFDGPFYRLRSPGSVVSRVDVPTFVTGGWWDLFQRGEPRLYRTLRMKPGRKQLLMGPWYHITAGQELDGPGTPPNLQTLALAWFDRWLKGIHNGIEDMGPVTLYELGRNRYVTERTWPRRSILYKRLYLSDRRSGSARSLFDGSLTAARPSAGSASGAGNILNGLCTRNSVQWTAGIIPPGSPCTTDNRFTESSAFTFTTPPLARDLHISGPIDFHLRGATTAKDTTWVTMLTDVQPDGRSEELTAGWLLQSRRALKADRTAVARNGSVSVPWHPFTSESLLPVRPRVPDSMDVEIFNTDAVIRKGHRLRLVVTSGDVPHLLSPLPAAVQSIGAVNTVYMGGGDASDLNLPVVQEDMAPMRVLRLGRRVRRNRTLPVLVWCPDTEYDCQVRLRLATVRPIATRSGHRRRLSVGASARTIPAGRRTWVRVRVRRAAVSELRRRRRGVRLAAVARLVDEAGVAATSRRAGRVRAR